MQAIDLYHLLTKRRFVVLLIALSVRLLLFPLFQALFPSVGSYALRSLAGILFICILLSALLAASQTRTTLIISLCLLLTGIALDGICSFSGASVLASIGNAVDAVFLVWCVVLIVSWVFTVKRVTFDTIAASLSAYLMIGLAWGSLYAVIERLHPGSFINASVANVLSAARQGELPAVYFSMVTLSTLGYGDIVPATDSVRMLVVAEALLGQIYLAVLVARLVGMHLSGALSAQTMRSQRRS
jgi:hypothetical protein